MNDPGRLLTLAVLGLSAGTLAVVGVAGWKVTTAGATERWPSAAPAEPSQPGDPVPDRGERGRASTSVPTSNPIPSAALAEPSQPRDPAPGLGERGRASTSITLPSRAEPSQARAYAHGAAEWVIDYVEELRPEGPPPPEPGRPPRPARRPARRADRKIEVPRSMGARGT